MDLWNLTSFKENGVKVKLHNPEVTFLPQSTYESLTDSLSTHTQNNTKTKKLNNMLCSLE